MRGVVPGEAGRQRGRRDPGPGPPLAETEAAAATKRIAGLDERQRAAVERAIEQTVRKVVHLPTVRTKEACARGDEHLLQAARWLFGLDDVDAELSSAAAKKDGA